MADAFFEVLAHLVAEWLDHETPLCLPTSRDPLVAAAMGYTADHLAEVTSSELCRTVGTSARSLRRAFLAATGMPWRQYLLESRLLKAMALLADEGQNVITISMAVGFHSASAFTRAFDRYTGETPTAYRQRIRAAHAAAATTDEWPSGLASQSIRQWSHWDETRYPPIRPRSPVTAEARA
jgi:AraC-like DNA-binding protein